MAPGHGSIKELITGLNVGFEAGCLPALPVHWMLTPLSGLMNGMQTSHPNGSTGWPPQLRPNLCTPCQRSTPHTHTKQKKKKLPPSLLSRARCQMVPHIDPSGKLRPNFWLQGKRKPAGWISLNGKPLERPDTSDRSNASIRSKRNSSRDGPHETMAGSQT